MPGLAEALTRCYDTGKLPAEAGVPWAVPAPAETTEGYTAFTGRLFKEAWNPENDKY